MSGSTPTPGNHKHSVDMPKSHFNKTVCLSDWWLVKVRDGFQGRRLAVAGFPYRGKSGSHAMRVFTSAPILKRHHVFSIETTDGISVFFEGYINKARTKENGFPSDVYSHFVFGFPPYWREYAEILMDEGSSSVGTSGFTRLKTPSPPRTEFESGQPHVDNGAEDFQSQQESKKTESPFVSWPEKPDSVSSDPENNLIISGIAPEGLENESYSRGSIVEDHNISAVMDEVLDDTQVDTSRGVLLACELHSKSTDNLSKVGLDKINSSLEILSRTEGRARTRSMNNSEMKQKNDKKSARISVGGKIRSNFVKSMGPEKSDSVTSDPENNLIISGIAPEGLENESYSRGPTVEKDHNISAVMDEVVDDTQDNTSRGVLLVCELHSKSTDDLSKVGLDKINSSLEILSRSGGRARTRSMKNSEVKQKNDKKSARISVGEKMRSKFVSSMGSEIVEKVAPVGCEPDKGRNNWNFEAFEIHSCTDKKKLSEFGTPKVKDKGNIKKAKTKATRSMGMAAAADNQEDNIPHNAKSSGMKTRRKLEYQTPDREKDEVASPQCMSFKRSRSGRLLMPTLEFWRNQRAVYGLDRTITGIEEGRINPDPPRKGRPSTPHRKRR